MNEHFHVYILQCFDAKDLMAQAGISHDGTPTAHQKEMVANLIVTYVLQGKDELNTTDTHRDDYVD